MLIALPNLLDCFVVLVELILSVAHTRLGEHLSVELGGILRVGIFLIRVSRLFLNS